MPMLNAKIIMVGAALFAAPNMAHAGNDVETVDALIKIVAAERVCGFPVPPRLTKGLIDSIVARIPPEKAVEFGLKVRRAGEAYAEEILSAGKYEDFCNGMARAYAKVAGR